MTDPAQDILVRMIMRSQEQGAITRAQLERLSEQTEANQRGIVTARMVGTLALVWAGIAIAAIISQQRETDALFARARELTSRVHELSDAVKRGAN